MLSGLAGWGVATSGSGPGATVVLESTTFPGTTEELLVPILEAASGLVAGDDFHVGYSPERIDPGNPVWNLQSIPKGEAIEFPRAKGLPREISL